MCNDLYQRNSVVNSLGRMLNLMICNRSMMVERDFSLMVRQDAYHRALAFDYLLSKSDTKVNFKVKPERKAYDFRRAIFPELYRILREINWDFLANLGILMTLVLPFTTDYIEYLMIMFLILVNKNLHALPGSILR